MIALVCIGHPFHYEMECTLRVFFPGERIAVSAGVGPETEHEVRTKKEEDPRGVTVSVRSRIGGAVLQKEAKLPVGADRGEQERVMSGLLFEQLCDITGSRPPWGILTGVRPVRLGRRWMHQGMSEAEVRRIYEREYLVLPEKAALALKTTRAQDAVLRKNLPDTYSLYVSIPFCPSRCLYCSFVSHAIEKAKKLVPEYIRLLCEELRQTAALAGRLDMRLLSIYVGGGTPTSLSAEQLEQVLTAIDTYFDRRRLLEYTVEAGRPDTISPEKLAVLKRYKVDRISLNPQSMEDKVLRAIGRGHTAAQIVESYRMAREAGFTRINMDMIAGLPEETPESFMRSLRQVIGLGPENVTVHTLTVKRSSALRKQEDAFAERPLDLQALLGEAGETLSAAGYRPYYLYRQKGTVQNQENTGYSLPGREGVYNIYSMEDAHTIFGAGAGAGTKLCSGGEPVRRIFNHKYPYEYVGRFEELMLRKSQIEEWRTDNGNADQGTDGEKIYPVGNRSD